MRLAPHRSEALLWLWLPMLQRLQALLRLWMLLALQRSQRPQWCWYRPLYASHALPLLQLRSRD